MFFGAFAFSCSAGQVAQPFSTLRLSFHLHTHPECPELNLAVHWTRLTWCAVPALDTWESYIVIVYNTAGHLIILLEGSSRIYICIHTQLHPLTALILRHIGTWGIPTLMLNQKSFLDVIFFTLWNRTFQPRLSFDQLVSVCAFCLRKLYKKLLLLFSASLGAHCALINNSLLARVVHLKL